MGSSCDDLIRRWGHANAVWVCFMLSCLICLQIYGALKIGSMLNNPLLTYPPSINLAYSSLSSKSVWLWIEIPNNDNK